ncbi:low temperature requirement protein A [Saccharopolyspora sp. NFXS83]|uniref:low temperature requirement protein A n=1 Tax=Saccharopolyspora sp. NFXS83 TaxID=2993560 RepID=UPI00224A53B6|nr:low temperature requirement protein A [Saccharopolyspora sp. NFXS83]MCX2730058.1 low temperature requirement protein A [Saccharopolyspora sp. NFXS83]
MTARGIAGWHTVMRARDPREGHRAATPLELLFDLCFVVAVSQAATQWHHALSEGHAGSGLAGYLMVFFAIWWAWMNFTWFASAYDTDDVPYRLLTLLQMAGVLVLAAGVPAAFTEYDFTVITLGYVLMRVAMIGQWLRAAAEHPEGRRTALRYAAGITVVQLGWIARLALPQPWGLIGFVALAVAERLVPIWAEYRGESTSWHPEHIAERYGLLTIIVLGEVILATLAGVQDAISEHGLSPTVLLVILGGLVLVFSLWWIYFTGAETTFESLRTALVWGYGHYLIFASIAAVGSGLHTALNIAEHTAHTSVRADAFALAVPVGVFLLVLLFLHRLTGTGAVGRPIIIAVGAVLVLALAAASDALGIGATVLAIGLATAATLAAELVSTARSASRS